MNQPLSLVLTVSLLLAALASSPLHAADESATLKTQIVTLQREVEMLRADNERLKLENQTLKLSLNAERQKAGGASQTATVAPSNLQPSKAKAAGFWITTSTGKRHNAKCRYYMNSKGRASGPDEGLACKLCGG